MEATAEVTTPVAAPDTSSTVPAAIEPTPVSTPATGGRPQSAKELAQAMERMDKAAGLAAPPDAATIPPADPTAQPPVTPPATGPIPFDVHHKALENARTNAVQQRDQQWQKEAGWVMSLPPERREAAPRLVQDYYANPALFAYNIGKALENHPQWGSQYRALMGANGHGNGNGNGHAPVSDEPQPDVEIIVNPQTGQTVRSYSAEQQAKREAWLSKQYDQRWEARLAPYEQERKALKTQQEQAEFDRQATATVEQSTNRILKILEGRTDLVQHVNSLMDSGSHWLDAALQVKEQHLKPQQAQQATAAAADAMRRKAVAGSTANGGSTTTTPIGRPKNHKELAALLESLDSRG